MDNVKVWKGVVIVGAVIILILGYLLVTMEPSEQKNTTGQTDTAPTKIDNKATMEDKTGNMTDSETSTGDTMIKQDEMDKTTSEMEKEIIPSTTESPTMSKATPGTYTTYDADKVATSEAENILLFFHAAWCPSCRTLDADLNKNLSLIPEGTEIYKADYDKSIELKQKYGVTSQHTLVLIKKDGTMIKKWSGGGTLASILENI